MIDWQKDSVPIAIVVVGVVAGLLTLAAVLVERASCRRWEKQAVHHEAEVRSVYNGKVFVPTYFGEYTTVEEVCVEYEGER